MFKVLVMHWFLQFSRIFHGQLSNALSAMKNTVCTGVTITPRNNAVFNALDRNPPEKCRVSTLEEEIS